MNAPKLLLGLLLPAAVLLSSAMDQPDPMSRLRALSTLDPAHLEERVSAGRALESQELSEFGISQGDILAFRLETANALLQNGRNDEAAHELNELVPLLPQSGASDQASIYAFELLGVAERNRQRWEAAQTAIEQALALRHRVLGPTHPSNRFDLAILAQIIEQRALIATRTGQAPEADGLNAQARQLRTEIAALTRTAAERQRSVEAPAHADDPTRSAGTSADVADLVRVFFGTNRALVANADPAHAFGNERAPIRFGVATVSVPHNREIGTVPRANIWLGEFRPDPSRHVIVTDVDTFPGLANFIAGVRAQVARSRRHEALVYIHGFNTDFEAALDRAAQLAVDLEIDGAPIVYSWPSQAGVMGYVADGNQLTRPLTQDLAQFLQVVATQSGAQRIFVVAHSMGNRFLMSGLEALSAQQGAGGPPLFDDVVFAEPDVDADDFRARLPALLPLARRMTLYTSTRDQALRISSLVNGGYARAGDAARPVLVPGLDTVDTSAACTTSFCHEEFVGSGLDDFRAVVWLSLSPQRRCILSAMAERGLRYWSMRNHLATTCEATAFRSAITLTRRIGREASIRLLQSQITLLRSAGNAAEAGSWAATLRIVQAIPQN